MNNEFSETPHFQLLGKQKWNSLLNAVNSQSLQGH